MKFFGLVAATLLSAQAMAVDLNGIELGSQPTIPTLHEKLGMRTVPGTFLTPGTYSGDMNLAGCPALTNVTADGDSRVTTIQAQFDPTCFDQLASQALLKWGKPSTSGDYELSNAYGRRVAVHEHDWTLPDGSLIVLVNVDPVLQYTQNMRGLLMGTLTLKTAAAVEAGKIKKAASGNL